MNTLRWHLLQPLGRLLADVAQVMGAHRYVERYQRDLALDIAKMAATGASGALAAAFVVLSLSVRGWVPS